MKHIILGLIILINFGYGVKLEHIKWNWDYEKALLKAKKQHKPILLFLQKKDSKQSKKMLFETLCNQPYVKYINNNYIAIVAFFEDKNSYPIELFYTQDFPTLFIINPTDESLLHKPIVGYMPPKQFQKIISLYP